MYLGLFCFLFYMSNYYVLLEFCVFVYIWKYNVRITYLNVNASKTESIAWRMSLW